MNNKKLFLSVALAALIAPSFAAPAAEQVQALPDAGPLPTPWYSGYIAASATKQLHYIFVESQNDTKTDPVVIWLNGGPGCSSMLGAFSENGPFVFDDGQDILKPNEFAWNNRANLLYIESPAHVGFSIGGPNDWNFTDMSQSVDLFAAVQNFYTKFPEYLTNPLWISGESYAGVYGPYLAWQIHSWNQAAEFQNLTTYNLKGFAVGNGITDWNVDAEPATWQTFTEFNLVPEQLYNQFATNDCKYNVAKPYTNPKPCATLETQVNSFISGLNPYDLFRTTYGNGQSSNKRADAKRFLQSEHEHKKLGDSIVGDEIKRYQRGVRLDQYTPWVKNNKLLAAQAAQISFGDPMSDYLNRADVRAALHIPISVQAWEGCTSNENFTYPFSYEASVWIYGILKAYGYQLMHYSGDTDGVVPTIGTRRWIQNQKWQVTSDWEPWTTDGQVSGYTISYDNFRFATIHGVGHMAPQWKRKDTRDLIIKYIHGESYLEN